MALSDNLNAYWDFDESSGNAADATGNGNTFTNTSSESYVTGKIGNAIELSSANVSAADSAGLSITSDLTISLWVKINTLPGLGQRIPLVNKEGSYGLVYSRNKSGDGGTYGLYININVTSSSSAAFQIGGGDSYGTAPIAADGNFHHVSITWVQSTGAYVVKIDGSTTSSGTTGTSAITDNGNSLVLAGSSYTFTNGGYFTIVQFSGVIDELGIWARALSTTETDDLYNSGSGLAYPFATNVTVTPSAQVVTASIPTYTVSAQRVVTVTPSAQTATFSVPAYTVSLPKVVAATVQTATFSIPTYTVDAGGNITIAVNAQTATFSIPAYSLLYDFVVAVNALSATFSTPTRTISAGTGVSIAPSAQVATFSVQTYTLVLEANLVISASVLTATFSLPTLAKVGAVWVKKQRSTDASWSRVSRNSA